MKGFLLAAGFGTRLWPLSDVRAKPAFPYRGVPLIVHASRLMSRHGITEQWVNTHHLPDSIHAALASADLHPKVVHEPEILGTAGALYNLRDEFKDGVLTMNAKVVTDIDLGAAVKARKGPALLVCVRNTKREKFTHVAFDATGALTGFLPDLPETPYLFTGIQVLGPRFFDALPGPGFYDTVKDVYPKLMKDRIDVFIAKEGWAEFSTLQRYRDLHAGGFIDPRATVKGDATGAVVWEHAEIGEGANVRGAIIADGVKIPRGFSAESCAVIQADRVRDHKGARVEQGLLVVPI